MDGLCDLDCGSTPDRGRVLKVSILTLFRVTIYADARWSAQRVVFGKPLTSQAVIRSKLANMISRVECCQNWFESVTYQMNNASVHFHVLI